MYLDLWRKLQKDLSNSWGSISRSEIVRMMNQMEREVLREAKFDKNPGKALKHLRKVSTYHLQEEDV